MIKLNTRRFTTTTIVLSWSAYPVYPDLSRLSCPGLTCLGFPDSAILSQLSCPSCPATIGYRGCLVSVVLLSGSSPSVLTRQFFLGCRAMVSLSRLS
jgi:hypothetical protein